MTMTGNLPNDILEKLKSLQMPGSAKDIVSLGLVSDVFVSSGKAYFSISVPAEQARALEPLRVEAQRLATSVSGIEAATVVLTADKKAGSDAAAQPQRPPQPAPQPRTVAKQAVPGIGSIIAVASGKGGVGKSTTAVNLALGLQANGLRAGVLDADIYGPSLPRLLGLTGHPQQIDGRLIKPMENYGLKVMSMGFLVDEGTAMIWRGPMIQSALLQMLRDVAWGELDVLIIDMPPGTGDVQLTLAQQAALAGAVIVSTPQDLALIDARKAINMFNKVEVPVLGVIENMSHFVCPNCGTSHDIFGHGGARAEADKIGAPFLGEVPLDIEIRLNSDAGTPITVKSPEGPHALAYREIARKLWDEVQAGKAPSLPEITFE
jgi:ATP-binding protein involved in chromosome partitioning